jgi:hypothetical protein
MGQCPEIFRNDLAMSDAAQNLIHFTPLRYPGGKAKLAAYVKRLMKDNRLLDGEYVEPYRRHCAGAPIPRICLAHPYQRSKQAGPRVLERCFAAYGGVLSARAENAADGSAMGQAEKGSRKFGRLRSNRFGICDILSEPNKSLGHSQRRDHRRPGSDRAMENRCPFQCKRACASDVYSELVIAG